MSLRVSLLPPKRNQARLPFVNSPVANSKLLILVTYLIGGHFLSAASNDSAAGGNTPSAIKSGKEHVRHVLSADLDGLKNTMAPMVTLMPGHEFLKPEYGFAKDPKRSVAAKVERKKLIEIFSKKMKGRAQPPKEKIDGKMKVLKFENLPIVVGDFATDPSDGVATPDGKLHFQTREGDVVLKVSPPKGDFLLLHLRLVDGKWRVVSQYLD